MPSSRTSREGPGFRFPRRLRLLSAREFTSVYDGRVRCQEGPLLVWARPSGLDHCRIGLSIGRKVGNAVVRNRVKRLLRTAFRLHRHEWPAGYDVVVGARPHEPLSAEGYAILLGQALRRLHGRWSG